MHGFRLRAVVLLLFAFCTGHIVAQDSTSRENDVYAIALKVSILQMEKEWGHLASGLPDEAPTEYRHVIVRRNPAITDALPSDFESHLVEILDDDEIVARYRKLKKSFAVLEVAPMRTDGAELKIVVGTYWFSSKHGRREFAYSDWSDVRFHYDCDTHKFALASVTLGGI